MSNKLLEAIEKLTEEVRKLREQPQIHYHYNYPSPQYVIPVNPYPQPYWQPAPYIPIWPITCGNDVTIAYTSTSPNTHG